jgi:heme exporter protein D
MDLEIFNLSGYGKFVWPAFFLTFSSCFLLFVKTKKELKKQEKNLSENYKQLKTITFQTAPKKNTKKILSGSSIL